MATIYNPPDEVGPEPDFSRDVQAYLDEVDKWWAKIEAWCKEHGKGDPDLLGERIRFNVADGYAVYFVYGTDADRGTVSLIHASALDNYAIPEAHERGLNFADIREAVRRERALRSIFSGSSNGESGDPGMTS